MTTVSHATTRGIDLAESGLTASMREAALAFFHDYAAAHTHFTGGDVLSAWRESGASLAHADWRNRWGAICREAAKLGWVSKVGRARPTTSQSHSATLVLWESNLCASKAGDEAPTHLTALKQLERQVMAGELAMPKALWRAYELGTEVVAR